MARHKHTLPAGTFRVVMYAYCGMSYDVATGLDRRSAMVAIGRLAARRIRSGHPTTRTFGAGGLPEYEFSEPEDCALIPDTAGTAAIVEETVPAWECAECGDILPIGTSCTCQDPIEEEQTEDSGRYVSGHRVYRDGSYREDFGSDR